MMTSGNGFPYILHELLKVSLAQRVSPLLATDLPVITSCQDTSEPFRLGRRLRLCVRRCPLARVG